MKADLSRTTFDRANGYRTVRMQQGRVQLDADWNEQQDILNNRIETETGDSLGPVAVPMSAPGFRLTAAGNDITISAGRLYVDGLLCENPSPATVARQPDLPHTASPVLPAAATVLPLPPKDIPPGGVNGIVVFNDAGQAVPPADGIYLAYLEAWQRHLSVLEEPGLREVALGGPDTCSREKTVWQVKLLRAGDTGATLTCLSQDIAGWNTLTARPSGTLAARAETSIPPKTPCQLPPEAGYRLLENRLYRVEVHDDGSVTGKARYKWSRDNGSVASRVVRWLDDPIANEFEVVSIGRDEELAISAGCWLEFTDDTHELLGQPGPLVPALRTEGNVVTIDLTRLVGHPLDQARFPALPRVRRWDGFAEIKAPPATDPDSGWEELAQDGIELQFGQGSYRIGDYWLIPARSATAAIEWPQENGAPMSRAPAGVQRAFARLALFEFSAGAWSLKSDCRPLFPALTELTQLHYVGGDGQSVMPNPAPNDPPLVRLPAELKVGITNGRFPVEGAQVRFTAHSGQLTDGKTQVVVQTSADGIASTPWSLASNPGQPLQHAIAELLVSGEVVLNGHLPVIFSAQLALASTVAYEPGACSGLQNQTTVQQALDKLCTDLTQIRKSDFIIVTNIHLRKGPRKLDNNEFVRVEELLDGFAADFDDKLAILPQDHFEPVAQLTLDIPFPSGRGALLDWSTWLSPGERRALAFGTTPLHLSGTVSVEESMLIWTPEPTAVTFLKAAREHRFGLSWPELAVKFGEPYVRGWITLRGDCIWAGSSDKRRYLNGDMLRFASNDNPFSIFDDDGSGLPRDEQLRNRTDPQRAADFRLWFKLDVRG